MDSVKIGPIVYAIEETERLQNAVDRSLWGQIKYDTCVINLEAKLAPQFKRVVLWHEILHGILIAAGVDGEQHDESLLDQIAYGIVQVLQDNPELAINSTSNLLAQLRDSAVQTQTRKRNAAAKSDRTGAR